MLKIICFMVLGFGCVASTFLSPEGELLFGNLIKSLAPLGAQLTPGVGIGGQGVPGGPGVVGGVPGGPGVVGGVPGGPGVIGGGPNGPNGVLSVPGGRGGCPLCDSSVYSYCSVKMIHDACCCSGGGAGLPFNCHAMDCTYLNANSCQEHALIFTCCCNNPYHK